MLSDDNLLAHFAGVKMNGSGWTCRCPAHDDGTASLSVGHADDRWLLHCHAGCEFGDIVSAAGLSMTDLFDDEPAKPTPGGLLADYSVSKALPVGFLRTLGLSDGRHPAGPCIRIPYRDETGKAVATRFRFGPDSDTRFLWKRGSTVMLYGLDRLKEARRQGRIVICEGESDSHTLWLHGVPALGLPGADCWREERDAPLLDGIGEIFVIDEQDRGGETVRKWLAQSSIRGRAKVIRLAEKDPSGLYVSGPDTFVKRWNEACRVAVPWDETEDGKAEQDVFPADRPSRETPRSNPGTGKKEKEKPKAGPHFQWHPFLTFGRGLKPVYLVKGLIPAGGLTVIWGPPKCGKSFWTLDLATHIARGIDYRGHRVRKGRVVYLALEGEAGMAQRRDAYVKAHGLTNEDVPLYVITTPLDLRKQVGQLIFDIRAQAGKEPIDAIVVDTLNRSLVGSENEPKDMSDYVRATDELRRAFKCAVILIHHCGVNGERPRGHSSLTGAADAQLAVKMHDDGTVTVTAEHMKDGPFGEVIACRLDVIELGEDEDGDMMTSCVIVEADAPKKTKPTKELSDDAKLAYGDLIEAVLEHGQEVPTGPHVPDHVKGVTIDQWRELVYRRSGDDEDDPKEKDRRKKAFQRVRTTLRLHGYVGISAPYAWPAKAIASQLRLPGRDGTSP